MPSRIMEYDQTSKTPPGVAAVAEVCRTRRVIKINVNHVLVMM